MKAPAKAALFLLLLAPAAHACIRLTFSFTDGSGVFMKRNDAASGGAGIQFYINDQIVAGAKSGATGSSVEVISAAALPVNAIRAAAAAWSAVPGSAIRFLPLKTTSKLIDPGDLQHTIAIGSTAADLSVLGYKSAAAPGAVAVTLSQSAGFVQGTSPTGDISDSDIVLNPSTSFSTDGSTAVDLQAVLTHEFGHALGLNHSGLWGATMFQYTALSERYLSRDEVAFAASVYPSSQANTLSKVSGKVISSDGSAVQSALVTLVDTAGGNTLTALTFSDGAYSAEAPAGTYVVYAEPMTSGSAVQPGNLYLSSATAVTSNFEASTPGGWSSPTSFVIAPNSQVSIPNLIVASGSSALSLPYAAIGKAGALGDIQTVFSATPLTIPSGQAIDLALIGGGLNSSASIQVVGQGITVRPGSVRVDPAKYSGSLAGATMIRATFDITAREAPSLASVIVTQGSNTYALSGMLMLVPPTPVFTANAVVSAASYKGPTAGGGVSPGGIYSIYASAGNSLGPAQYAVPSGYDVYGNLATTLGGVTVTFDGVPAPLYLSYGAQLNFQAPFETSGKTVSQVVVDFNGSRSAPVTVPVVPTQPAFFTATPLGTDVVTQNFPGFTRNSASNPAGYGDFVLFYGTGIGALKYPVATGQPGTVPPSTYSSTYSCLFGDQKSTAYAYWNYGFVGEALWTVPVPPNAFIGAVTLTCTDSVSGATTQPAIVYLK